MAFAPRHRERLRAAGWTGPFVGPDEALICVVERVELRRYWPRAVCGDDLPRSLAPPLLKNLCIVSCASDSLHVAELQHFVAALRLVREPLYVVWAWSGAGEPVSCADEQLQLPPEGYDIVPFARALASPRAEPLGPFVSKVHSKHCDQWRRALFTALYVRPDAADDLLLPSACLARYEPGPDQNTALWCQMHEQGWLRRPPEPTDFVAGSMFTARRALLEELLHWTWPATRQMRTGADGQPEHVAERYLGLLTAAVPSRVRHVRILPLAAACATSRPNSAISPDCS